MINKRTIGLLLATTLFLLAGCGPQEKASPGDTAGISRAASFSAQELKSGANVEFPGDFTGKKSALVFFSSG